MTKKYYQAIAVDSFNQGSVKPKEILTSYPASKDGLFSLTEINKNHIQISYLTAVKKIPKQLLINAPKNISHLVISEIYYSQQKEPLIPESHGMTIRTQNPFLPEPEH